MVNAVVGSFEVTLYTTPTAVDTSTGRMIATASLETFHRSTNSMPRSVREVRTCMNSWRPRMYEGWRRNQRRRMCLDEFTFAGPTRCG